MDEQITLGGFEPEDAMEAAVYQQILPRLQAAAAELDAPIDLISRENTDDYSSIYYKTGLSFRLRLRKKVHYVEVKPGARELVMGLVPLSRQRMAHEGEGTPYWRVLLEKEGILDHADALGKVLKYTIEHLPKEWDCCSRYMECSDARKCVHPDKGVALDCGYRKILASGRIFYGGNRNID
jgi:hypothetical protein